MHKTQIKHRTQRTKTQHREGFTLLEFLITVSIIFILALMGIAALSNYRKSAAIGEGREKILTALASARAKTLGSEANASYGIHFEETRVVMFRGGPYLPSDPENKETILPPGVTIRAVALGGGADVVFERLTGKALAAGTVMLTAAGAPQDITITIYSSGAFE